MNINDSDPLTDAYFLNTLDVNHTNKTKLIDAGLTTLKDFQGLTITSLSKEAEIPHKDAMDILNKIREMGGTKQSISAQPSIILSQQNKPTQQTYSQPVNMSSGLDMFEKPTKKLVTMCPELDVELLNGGIPCDSVTEICGVPGIGKTQLGMQLAVNVQMPEELGGCGGSAIYIDTEGSFMVDRVYDIAANFLHYLKNVTNDEESCVSNMSVDSMLSNIQYYRIYNYIEQISLVNVLLEQLRQAPRDEPPVKVIIIDSITFHFRYGFDVVEGGMAKRTKLLSNMSNQLSQIANEFQCAVIVMNQVTTRVENDVWYVAPALGQTWSHQSTNKLYLEYDAQRQQQVRVTKIKNGTTGSRHFTIVAAGFRGIPQQQVEEEQEGLEDQDVDGIGQGGQSVPNEFNKRPRI
ncbi:RAD51-like protein [Acrasis kona]|uniref:DNA repair protein RAD51 homolog 3 n=1 Tax=Acrasis kona TaxID=1008807 RepID=A0AAW2ZE99_9EUKA